MDEDSQIRQYELSEANGAEARLGWDSLPWYDTWLAEQWKDAEQTLGIKIGDPIASAVSSKTRRLASAGSSIDIIANTIIQLNLIPGPPDVITQQRVTQIVFAVVGWQTMLYQPSFGTCPSHQFAIADTLDGYTGQAFMTLKQDYSRVNRALPDFLLGFGLMLPRENLCISDDPEDLQAFEKVVFVNPEELNAALLITLAHVTIKWVDVLSPHLEFDQATTTLFLFRYPSFCKANLDDAVEQRNTLYRYTSKSC